MTQLAGRVRIVLNGREYQSKPGAKFDPGGITWTTVTGDNGIHRVSSLRPAKVDCEMLWTKGFPLAEVNGFIDGTVQFITDVDATHVLNNAWRTGELMATAGESGGVPTTFEAESSTEVGSA